MKGNAYKTTTVPVDIGKQLFSSGIQPTPQRIAIAQILFAAHQHVTADELFAQLSKNQSQQPVSKATVYNTLGLFVKKGLLREVILDTSGTFYDTNTHPHHHFYNLDTGQLIDMEERLLPCVQGISVPENTVIEDIAIMIRIRNKQ